MAITSDRTSFRSKTGCRVDSMRTTRFASSGPRPHIASAALMHDVSSGRTIGIRARRIPAGPVVKQLMKVLRKSSWFARDAGMKSTMPMPSALPPRSTMSSSISSNGNAGTNVDSLPINAMRLRHQPVTRLAGGQSTFVVCNNLRTRTELTAVVPWPSTRTRAVIVVERPFNAAFEPIRSSNSPANP